MYYKTKDGAEFTKWWHPICYALLVIAFWPLYVVNVRGSSNVGAGCIVTIIGWGMLAMLVLGFGSFLFTFLHLTGAVK